MTTSHTQAEVNGLGQNLPVNGHRRTVPFDYAFRFQLERERDKTHTQTVTVSIEARFTALSIGYGVVPKPGPVKFGLVPKRLLPPAGTLATLPALLTVIDVASISLASAFNNAFGSFGFAIEALAESLGEPTGPRIGRRTAAVLTNGIKLNPAFAEKLLLTAATGSFDRGVFAEAFQAIAAPPEQIQFLYSIFDEGTGREFQSEPILNTAGLGTADGMRPFRYFARPIEFAPRSVIRMQIIEKSEFQGELHVSLQGYKTLGTPGSPTELRRLRRMRR